MSDLVGNPEDRFSHVAAHLILSLYNIDTLNIGLKKFDIESLIIDKMTAFGT